MVRHAGPNPSPCTFPFMVVMRCEIFMGRRESPTPFSPWSAHALALLGHTELCLLKHCPAATSFRLTQGLQCKR